MATRADVMPGGTERGPLLRRRRQQRIKSSGAERVDASVRERILVWALRLATLAALIGIWALVSGRLVRTFFISSPSAVASQLYQWSSDGMLWSNLWVTLEEIVIGFFAGAIAGMVLGIVIGLGRRVSQVIEPFAQALYSVPKIALMPLFIVWFGIETLPKIVLAALSVFFVVFFTTFSGVREVDAHLVDVLRVMGGNRRQVTRKVVIPATLTWIFAGLRISVPQAFIGAVAGEILVSNRGIGFLIEESATNFNTAGVFAGLVVIVVVAAIFAVVLNAVEKRALRWKLN
jgi:NitT/TauT family transport system permease protein